MNGRFLLDTNAIIALLKGDNTLVELVKGADWVGISVIAELEFRCFSNLSMSDAILFESFKKRVEVLPLTPSDEATIREIIRQRATFGLKLPDAIIAACAIRNQAVLMSNDAAFQRVPHLTIRGF